jgi:hypothetical protein
MIHIRVGSKEDKCRSVYGILYDVDGDPFRSNGTSFWTGILDGNTNIREHTKDEVMTKFYTRAVNLDAEYQIVCDVMLDEGSFSYYEIAKKMTTFLRKGRNKASSPEKLLAGLPKFLGTMGVVKTLYNAYDAPKAPDFKAALRSIQGSCPWAF